MMEIVVVGRSDSGKSTVIEMLRELNPTMRYVEVHQLHDVAQHLDSQIIFIDTPALLCYSYSGFNGRSHSDYKEFDEYYLAYLQRQEHYIKYVLELPNVIVIKNDKDIATLRVQIKKIKFL